MKILIIEDEICAVRRMEQMINSALKKRNIVPIYYESLDSVNTAIPFLKSLPDIDLLFLDIQLADGLSFEIFNEVTISTPVIFTTAFDEYAIRAFQLHSIDYLLKPIDEALLERALEKYFRMKNVFGEQQESPAPNHHISVLLETIAKTHKTYKSRFLVQSAQSMMSIPTSTVAYFFSEHKIVWLVTIDGKKYSVDYTLEQLQTLLSPDEFFRLNRQYIAHQQAIVRFSADIYGKLKVQIHPQPQEDVIVGREKAGALKDWLDR